MTKNIGACHFEPVLSADRAEEEFRKSGRNLFLVTTHDLMEHPFGRAGIAME